MSLRQLEPTSIARATGFNKTQVDRFYNLLKELIEQNEISPEKIFNVDESGMNTVQKPSKIIAKKGLKQVGKLTSAEHGKTVTAICYIDSLGNFIPPLFIFPHKQMTPLLMNDAPLGAKGCVSISGWTDSDIFVEWLMHFQKATNFNLKNQFILILDNHASHIYLPAINFARKNGIIILSIPPHTLHRLQPLDIPFFGPLKTFYGQEADKWMISHPGRRITEYEVCKLFRNAYERAATMRNAASGFRAAGIVPYNCNVFSLSDFGPLTTEIEMEKNSSVSLQDTHVNMTSYAIQVDSNRSLNNGTTAMVLSKTLMPDYAIQLQTNQMLL